VVLLRALEDQHLLDSEEGRIAVGWLIVEDIAMVIALVVVPVLATALDGSSPPPSETGGLPTAIAVTIGKIGLFIALMLIVGKRLIPWALDRVSETGSRELFTLSVLAIALGIAFGSAALFDVSFALGAFFAGLILNESELGHKAAAGTLPLRDAFAVLFFVSVGMLFDPTILLHHPLAVAATLLIIVVGKSSTAWFIVYLFRYPRKTAMTISASLAQIGEFAFMLAQLGVTLGLLSVEGRDVILAGAILSIVINPLLFAALARYGPGKTGAASLTDVSLSAKDHVILVGYGRVGQIIGGALRQANRPLVVIENDVSLIARLHAEGVPAILGQASAAGVLESANVADARLLISAIPNVFEAGQAIKRARVLNPSLAIVARAHSDGEVTHLEQHGAHTVIMGEREIARRMLDYAVHRYGDAFS
jgi:CPA2 family monovalent cation:H+ antiporter-2